MNVNFTPTSNVHSASNVTPLQPSQKFLPSAVIHASHDVHGQLKIERQEKPAGDTNVTFNITLRNNHIGTLSDKVDMVISDTDPKQINQEGTFGHSTIELKKEMQNKGVGYTLHLLAGHTAVELDIPHFVIQMSSFGTGSEAICQAVEMIPTGGNDWELPATEFVSNVEARVAAKGWRLTD